MQSRTNRLLATIAIAGGAASLGGAGFFKWRIQENFKSNAMYKKSLELLREDGLASTSLGLPLKARWLDLADTTNNRTDSTCAKLMIPIEGSTTRGLLLARASKEAVGWELEAVELLVEGARDKISIFQRQEEADRRHVLL